MSINTILSGDISSIEYRQFIAKTARNLDLLNVPGLPSERSRRVTTALALAITNRLAIVQTEAPAAMTYFNNNIAAPLSVFASTLRESTLFEIEAFVDSVRSFWLMRVSAAYIGNAVRKPANTIGAYLVELKDNCDGNTAALLNNPDECLLVTELVQQIQYIV